MLFQTFQMSNLVIRDEGNGRTCRVSFGGANSNTYAFDHGAPFNTMNFFLKVLKTIILAIFKEDLSDKDGRTHVYFCNNFVYHDSCFVDLAFSPGGMCSLQSIL